jgi:TetR/AcrR family transcriptional regulator, cholesterol catabolism regulator
LSSKPRRGAREVGAKRGEILAVATEYFGRHGYEDTKWADVATAVGIGSTALYHYFESKLHCLLVIQADAIEDFHERFMRITGKHDDFVETLTAVLRDGYDLTEQEVMRNRVLVAEQGLAATPRNSPREEEARQLARSRIRRLEFAWATFLARGMEQGAIPRHDPELLTRAILGLNNSVWHWFRPEGALGLDEVAEFFVERSLDLAGVGRPAEKPEEPEPAPAS